MARALLGKKTGKKKAKRRTAHKDCSGYVYCDRPLADCAGVSGIKSG